MSPISLIRRSCLLSVLISLLSVAAHAQLKVEYEITFPNAVHHEAEVVAVFSGAPAGKPLELIMSRSSPGRYAFHEFSKNVYNLKAVNEQGAALTLSQRTPNEWKLSAAGGKSGRVRVSYTLFADLGSGTYAGVDASMAHLSIPATLIWARGWEN